MPADKIILSVDQPEQLIQKFINNDEQVLEKTYRHSFKMVRSYVLKNSGREADAKDIFQDAMLAAWLNMKEGRFTVKNEFSLSAYIYKIAKYKWLDKLKSKEVKSTQRISAMDYEDYGSVPDDLYETENRLKYLNNLYDRLDSKCKKVLNQFYYQKKKLEEIASAMSYDLGSIRTIKYRCMQKLRKMHDDSMTQTD